MKRLVLFVSTILLFGQHGMACTTAIVSGRATPDGRPILWKHRDSDHFNNKMMYFKGGKYTFIGLINSDDSTQVWAGTNSAGFSIMNSASYNLKPTDDNSKVEDQEGVLMKLALSRCETIEDFKRLLDSLPKPLGVEANFGVIDAVGGAGYFETDNFKYKFYDANEPSVAPNGYLIRTNYSISGRENEGKGYNRYNTAAAIIAEAFQAKDVTANFFLTKATISLRHELTQTDLADVFTKKEEFQNRLYPFRDYIVRYSSSSTVVVHGVKPGESPSLITTWVKLGFQPASISFPLWIGTGEKLPSLLSAPGKKNSLLCTFTLLLKKSCFPVQRGNDESESYVYLEKLGNNKNEGIMQINVDFEKEILSRTDKLITKWRKSGFHDDEAIDFYNELDKSITDYYGLLCDHSKND